MTLDCSWLEMLVALAEALDYLYDGGVHERLVELITNMGLAKVLATKLDRSGLSPYDELDEELVELIVTRIDENRCDASGHGGLFPLDKLDHPDQRRVEIWEQHAAYFREKLEGVMWTSTS